MQIEATTSVYNTQKPVHPTPLAVSSMQKVWAGRLTTKAGILQQILDHKFEYVIEHVRILFSVRVTHNLCSS